MDKIAVHYNEAVSEAPELLELKARAVLRKHHNLHEFVMGMGAVFFTDQNNEVMENKPYMEPVLGLIAEWDPYLRLTGEPMRFTADGPKVTNF